MDFETRREKVRKAMRKVGVEALLVTDYTNVTYLTGFTGEDSYLLLREEGETLLTDGRFTTQLSEECPGLDLLVRKPGISILQAVVRALKTSEISRLAHRSRLDDRGLGRQNLRQTSQFGHYANHRIGGKIAVDQG